MKSKRSGRRPAGMTGQKRIGTARRFAGKAGKEQGESGQHTARKQDRNGRIQERGGERRIGSLCLRAYPFICPVAFIPDDVLRGRG